MRIIADENIPRLQEYFAAFGEVTPVNGRRLEKDQLREADVLLVRSVTPVNRDLLEGTPVRFVGTCTIGTDHLDTGYLEEAGIRYASAPGCNAGGVVQYVLTALAHLRPKWLDLRIGVVGCGNVGGRLHRALRRLGVDSCAYDPFLEPADDLRLVDFDEVLQSDVVCVHTPLTHSGSYPTFHMIDDAALQRLRPGSLLLNAGRGGAVDNAALLRLLQEGADLQVVLDVWEKEPNIDRNLARKVTIGTPHIAGYSDEGRVNGSIMICQALAQHAQWSRGQTEAHLLAVQNGAGSEPETLRPGSLDEAVKATYDILGDHRRLMAAVDDTAPLGAAFDALRKHYPERHEPVHFTVELGAVDAALPGQLRQLGFQVVDGA